MEEKEKLLGETHLSTIDTAYCLACILTEKKEHSTALRLFNRASRARAQFFGPDDNLTIIAKKLTEECEIKVRGMMLVNLQLAQVSPSRKTMNDTRGSSRMVLTRGSHSPTSGITSTSSHGDDKGTKFPSLSATTQTSK